MNWFNHFKNAYNLPIGVIKTVIIFPSPTTDSELYVILLEIICTCVALNICRLLLEIHGLIPFRKKKS